MKIKVFQKPDGSVAVYYPNFNVKRPEESEQEFIDRQVARIERDKPEFKDYEKFDMDSDALPDQNFKRKWRIKNGSVEIDHSIKTDHEKHAEKVADVKAELKKAGLTDDAADFIAKGRVK